MLFDDGDERRGSVPLEEDVRDEQVDGDDAHGAQHDGEADLEVLHEAEAVAVLLGHSGADHVSRCADQSTIA